MRRTLIVLGAMDKAKTKAFLLAAAAALPLSDLPRVQWCGVALHDVAPTRLRVRAAMLCVRSLSRPAFCRGAGRCLLSVCDVCRFCFSVFCV
mmetsp:Transcript_31819/g.87091  ORF Transcript_31819/g.87091 Transcript_31819/m.87091 type:complete len:92 (+) Transcript_31819:474-749(+)